MKRTLLLSLFVLGGLSAYCQYWNGSTTVQTTTSSKVGLGVTTPVAKLDIKSSNPTGNTDPTALQITNTNSGGSGNIVQIWNGNLSSPQTYSSAFTINRSGQVSIGTMKPISTYANYKLGVDGDIVAKRCVIQVDQWADFVFQNNYQLPDLDEVHEYIQENKHLPGIPSETEIKEKGIDVGEMNRLLMQKVEELTLYLIDLKKENEEIKKLLGK
jgi:hypothetical protein